MVRPVADYATFQLDPAGRVTSWNRGAKVIKGYDAGEIIGQHFSVFYMEGDTQAGVPDEALERAARDGQWTDEGWRVRKSGERFWAHVTITALYDDRANGDEDRSHEDRDERTLLGFTKVARDMTERLRREKAIKHQAEALKKQAEELEGSEEKFRALAEKSLVGIAMLQEGVYEYVNPKFAEITGYERDDLIGHSPAKLFHPSDRDYVRAQMQRRLAGDIEEAHYEANIVTQSGETRTLEVLGSRLIYRGKPAIIGMMQDITDRKEAEKALRQSERRYRRLFETSQEAIVITSPGGTILDANPAACALNGHTREELIGMDASAFYSRTEREKLVRRLQEHGQVRGQEVRIRHKDGTEIICQVSATVWRNAEGEVEAIQSFTRDITEERRARQALEESEEKFRMLAEKALVGIAVVQDETVRYANPAYAEIFGYTPSEIIGCSPRAYIGTDDWNRRIQPQLEQLLAGKIDTFRHTSQALTKAGDVIFIEGGGGRIVYEGQPALLGMVRDITKRRHLQREVLNMQEEERRRLGQDLHDGMGSTLTGIGLILSALPRREGVGSGATRQIKEIRELIQECVRDVRRLSHGLAPSGLSGDGLVDALDRLVKHVEGGRLEVDERFSTDLDKPPTLSDEAAAHVYWIAQEAVTNAQKYAEASAITLRLTVEENTLIVEIEDNGQGFDPRRLEESFNEDSLGLRTMRYRAELLGGTIEIDTATGEGTHVTCRLPA